ncbi:TrbG/VirB9 family P-type conjugative transfer protein [Ruegeria sp. 2205SS24-7]|uniref:TrbG/VirB9 family P-type conjugative transfer protein n=1 Tax=Ruegeria discodermiae TaxID=3064389 RepID=UPI0027420C1A|nr:TrbG/VirB9 family P-type conjugative transfer protein [Ruegeria sp. 2205SS24-7]MDP5218817.1 TrbG/VirB9 family P-type conjugative transfer protein [Ruegeria sp. 2205SS24-7]
MLLRAALPVLLVALLSGPALSEITPQGGHKDVRIRYAVYDNNQVFRIETDLRHSTTIQFGAGERFEAVIVGDTESFQVDPIPELGNILTIKPHVQNASTNMTVITNRRSYAFHLREGSIPGRTGMFFEVRFRYPGEAQRSRAASAQPKGYVVPPNTKYKLSGKGDFRPMSVYDDGRFTYFTFPERGRQPAIFKADHRGRERTVNWTQEGNTVRVTGTSDYWTLRLGEDALCIYHDSSAIPVRN